MLQICKQFVCTKNLFKQDEFNDENQNNYLARKPNFFFCIISKRLPLINLMHLFLAQNEVF